ncbi:hypothetical protein [Enterobacter mori]|uniref:hypothetical protein n=1 Tax=Enterobacter mori TaxID=539813 RepID=UPI002A813735|nr:hypothetical protein [Enterobacter mori]
MATVKTWITSSEKMLIALLLLASGYNLTAYIFDFPVLPESMLSFVKTVGLVIGGL